MTRVILSRCLFAYPCFCDILLIGCGEAEVDLLAQQMEQLWMQKWNRWYSAVQERRSAFDAN